MASATHSSGTTGAPGPRADLPPVWLGRSGVLLIGYDTELGGFEPGAREHFETDRFLAAMGSVHRDLDAPCTLFVCGVTAERYRPAFEALLPDPLIEIAQHTYSHVLLKTVGHLDDTGILRYLAHPSMEALRQDVERAQVALAQLTGERPLGFCGPYGYAVGLQDRWDLVELLHEAGIRFCRTYSRRFDNTDLCDLSVDPFWYALQGFPDVLEIPVGEPCDVHVRPQCYVTVQEYSRRLDEVLEEVARDNRVWSYTAHDWSAQVGDPELGYIRRLITRARELGIEIMTHGEYYRRCCSARDAERKG